MGRKQREAVLRKALRVLADNPSRKRLRKPKTKKSIFSTFKNGETNGSH